MVCCETEHSLTFNHHIKGPVKVIKPITFFTAFITRYKTDIYKVKH